MRVRRSTLRSRLAVLALVAVTSAEALSQTVLFRETFDDVATQQDNGGIPEGQLLPGPIGTTGWDFVRDEAFNSDVRFGYNYNDDPGTTFDFGIPEAPNTQPGDVPFQGVALRTNLALGRADQAAIVYEDEAFTGRYQVQVDMYLQWAADAAEIGTTEHGGLFIGKDTPTNPASPDFPASTGAGALFTGEGGTTNFDHVILKNNVYPSIGSGQYTVTDFGFGTQLGYDNTDVNSNPANGDLIDLPALFPGFDLGGGNTQPAGAVGYRWVTLNADVDTEAVGLGTGTEPGTTTFSVTIAESGESYTLGTLDNSVIVDLNDGSLNGQVTETEQAPVDMSGRVTLTLVDFFTSVASDINLASVIFDNLVVTALPEPFEGDYNSDGVVDAADYTVFKDTLGSTSDLRADGNGNGAIDPGDLTVWSDNYGAVAPSGTAVPEPSTLAGCVIAAAALVGRRRRG